MCPHLEAPANGSVLYSDRVVGSVAQYSCDKGFSLVEDASVICQSDGTWSGEEPICQIGWMYYSCVILMQYIQEHMFGVLDIYVIPLS